jgi:RimJ/RimL family protein N-acetyltransferase
VDLVGKLVKLRAARPEDAQGIAANAADPDFARFVELWARLPYSMEDAVDFINRKQPDAVRWAVECLEDRSFLGLTGLHEIDLRNRNATWGIAIGPPSRWDKGYGTEACKLSVQFAFKHLGLEKVYLRVYEGNERGRRAYEKAGFKLEGTLPRDVWLDGALRTTYLMAVYRDDPLYA